MVKLQHVSYLSILVVSHRAQLHDSDDPLMISHVPSSTQYSTPSQTLLSRKTACGVIR